MASTSSSPPEEPEVVLGRPLLPSSAEVPLPCLVARFERARDELEGGLRREWEKLEAERLRLYDWETRLGDRIKSATARHAEERAGLDLDRELLEEQARVLYDREIAAAEREQKLLRRETSVISRELVAEKLIQSTLQRQEAARELAEQVQT